MEDGGGMAHRPDFLGSLAQFHSGQSKRGTEVTFSPASQALSGEKAQLETLLGESPTSQPLKERGQA